MLGLKINSVRLDALTPRALTRARRLMALGLVVSVLGDRVVAGGTDGLIVAGSIPVIWIALSTTVGEAVVFAFPAYARVLKRFSPDWALVFEDLAEAVFALLAIVAMLIAPSLGVGPLLAYLLILMILSPISDISDEFYGAKLAQVDERAALAYNSSVSAALAIGGFVIAVPAGSLIASQSVIAILVTNIVLSLVGAFVRARISREVHVGRAIHEDASDFEATGASLKRRQFFHDLFASGPASPLVSFLLGVIGALTGHLVLIWAAGLVPASPFIATSLIFFIFGVSAATGPLLAVRFRDVFRTETALLITAVASVGNILWFVGYIWISGEGSLVAAIVFIVINVTVGRLRGTVLDTHRQRFFKGTQYARIMSWSFAFGGAGTLIGIWLAYIVGVPVNPFWGLLIAAVLWVAPAVLVISNIRPKGVITSAS